MPLIVSPLANAKQPLRSYASIDRRNRFSDRLISAITPTVGVDIVSGQSLTVVSSPGLQITDKGVSLPGNGSRFLVSTIQTTSNDLTILYFGNFIGGGTDLKAGLGNTAGTQLFGFQQNSGVASRCLIRNTSGGSVSERSFSSFIGRTSQAVLVARVIGNAAPSLFTNGVPDDGSSATGSTGNASFNRAALGGIRRSTDGAAASSQLSTLLLVWDGALNDSEINAISLNPWQVFKDDEIRVWFATAAATFQPAWAVNSNVMIQGGIAA